MKRRGLALHTIFALLAVVLCAACASIGRPEGGPRDEDPPVFVHSNPAPGSLNFKNNNLAIYFDENIKVEDVMNKVVVSPVQKTPPRVSANGKRLSVELQDTLIDNTTYTIDFSDAVRDLNENNILDGFSFDFSTGPTRDSLVISGMLFDARNLEPAQGMIVGVYSNLSDTAISTLPFDRIAKTNQYGQFVIRNLAEGTYRLFAVNDLNRDYHWDRSEDVAFYDFPISPSVEPITVTDTLRASNGLDSIVMRDGVRYLPNDILLTWFNENYRAQYLKNNTRIDSTRILIQMGAPSDTFPVMTLLNTSAAGRRIEEISLLEHSGLRDSLTYWLTDPEVIHADTLIFETRYLKTDSLDALSWTTDTLRLINKSAKEFRRKLDEEREKAEKARKKAEKEGNDSTATAQPAPKINFLNFSQTSTGAQDINKPLKFSSAQPIDSIRQNTVRLEIQRDTVWVDLGPQQLVRDSVNQLLNYSLHAKWEPGAKYRLSIDSAAITGIYGEWNNKITNEFNVKNLDDYSVIIFKLSGYEPGEQVVVQLLNTSDSPVATQIARNGEVRFDYLQPNTYYARAFIDRNGNGLWDTGNINSKTQPEDVYYYSKKLKLKKNWDLQQSWNLNELPIDLQKPEEIKKNKPKTRDKNQSNRNRDDDEEEEEDDFYNPGGFGSNGSAGNRGGYGSSGLKKNSSTSLQR